MKDYSRVPYVCPEDQRQEAKEIREQSFDYFRLNNFRVLKNELRANGHHFLVKNPKNGNNESYLGTNTHLLKFVHTDSKKEPWIWEQVIKIKCTRKSHLTELEAAIQ